MLPDGWSNRALGTLVDRPIAYGVLKPERTAAGVPMIRINDVDDTGYVNWEDVIKITPEQSREFRRTILRAGDIALSVVGTIGRTLVADERMAGANLSRAMCVIGVANEIERAFTLQYLNGAAAQDWMQLHVIGNAQKVLNLGVLKTLAVPLPPLPEQRRIVAVLEAWDDAIITAGKLMSARKERFAWLQNAVLKGRVRLHGFATPWLHTSLSRVLEEHGTTSTGAEPVFSVSVHRGLVDQVEHLGRSFAAASTTHYNLVRPGDIVYTKSPTGDFPLGIIKQSKVDRDVIVSPLYGVFTPASRELGVLLDGYFADPDAAVRYLTPLVQKGAKNTIAVTNAQFLRGEIMLPSDKAEMVALASLVETARAELAGAESEIRLLRRQKRGLMQKLLTGEWRIAVMGDLFAPGGPVSERLEAAK